METVGIRELSVPRGSTVLLSYPKDANISWFVTQRQDGWGGGGRVFELGNPEGRGGSSSFGNSGGTGGQKTVPSVGGVWIFSGITQCTRMFPSVFYFLEERGKATEAKN